jgi:hypothetical protein
MEQRQPMVARVSKAAALLGGAVMIVNAFAGRWPGHAGLRFHPYPWLLARTGLGDRGGWWFPTGWSMQETAAGVVIVLLLVVSKRASRPRAVIDLPQQRSLAEQLQDLEAGEVVLTTPTVSASETTRSIVHSILATEAAVQPNVSAAIAHLGTGSVAESSPIQITPLPTEAAVPSDYASALAYLDADEVGLRAASEAAAARAPHVNTAQHRSLSASTLAAASDRSVREAVVHTPVTSVPLPTSFDEPPTRARTSTPTGHGGIPLPTRTTAPSPSMGTPRSSPSAVPETMPVSKDLDLDDLLSGLPGLSDDGSDLDDLLSGLDAALDVATTPPPMEDDGLGDLLDGLDDLL